ncbi:hypothetical protein NSI01_38880 [Pimelobacter simplex]|nr:hypothetical protein NSI01_38880 [Pimelobacter simplex]
MIVYDGAEYPGRHEALISEELFQRVQAILFGERRAGTRRRVHHHYLKGLLWCARCDRRRSSRPAAASPASSTSSTAAEAARRRPATCHRSRSSESGRRAGALRDGYLDLIGDPD